MREIPNLYDFNSDLKIFKVLYDDVFRVYITSRRDISRKVEHLKLVILTIFLWVYMAHKIDFEDFKDVFV